MSSYEISKSSLLSLKAEILKKQEEVKNKTHTNVKKVPLIIKNKGVEKRNETDNIEDLDILEKSRLTLEKKAKLYDKLSKSKHVDDDPASIQNRFLVRFRDKEKSKDFNDDNQTSEEEELPLTYDDPENSDDEWIEYVDCLGRTRTCLKKDLKYFKSRDKDYKRNEPDKVDDQNINIVNNEQNMLPDIVEDTQLLSDDMRKELLRQQWENEENELRNKDNIHYQDVLFNEARSHGVGYYGFSKDEDLRRQQQESLEKLRAETTEQQKKSQELKAMREQQLAARIRAAKNRKRARLGLPPEEEECEEEEIGPPVPQPEPSESDLEDSWKEKLLERARRNHIRPWDVGKEKIPEFYEYSQEEWVDKKRKERNDEFAPPSVYKRDFRAPLPKFESSQTNNQLKFTTKKFENKDNTKGVKGLNPYKNSEDMEDPFDEETRTFNQFQSSKGNNIYKRKYEVIASVQNPEVTDTVDRSCESHGVLQHGENLAACSRQGRSTETASDYHYDRFSSELEIEKETYEKESTTTESIEASIEAGLKFLRTQSERNVSICDSANSDMFAL